MPKILFSIFSLSLLMSCKVQDSDNEMNKDQKIQIVCTTSMLGDVVKAITGDKAQVDVLMGPGVDPHLFKASQGDIALISESNVLIFNGLHLEGKMIDVLEKTSSSKFAFDAGASLNAERLLQMDGTYDPHIWFDAEIWATVCSNLTDSLVLWFPHHQDLFKANSEAYIKELNDLHNWAKEQISTIPAEHRVLVTAHDAFGYFGRAYGLEVHALQGISTQAEFGLKDVSELVNFITENKIPAIFVESSISERSMKAVQKGCEERGLNVQVGGTLYSDAPGSIGTPEATYLGMFRHNVNTIKLALINE